MLKHGSVNANGYENSGRIQWSDATTSSGFYFVRLERATETISRKIALMR
ncbi:MAG: hypothetical protein U9Q76_02100 [candidate division WOR-3 bacterium]|nr:hypothetical protein [candidate division WOR-3 bacterium]